MGAFHFLCFHGRPLILDQHVLNFLSVTLGSKITPGSIMEDPRGGFSGLALPAPLMLQRSSRRTPLRRCSQRRGFDNFILDLSSTLSVYRIMDLDIEPDIDLIEPGLYLGNLTAASNLTTLTNHSISHILTVDTEPLPSHINEKDEFRTLYIQADDRPHVDLLSHFDNAIQFIEDGIKHGAVLVHCFFAVSRSATLVIAYIMKHTNLSVQEAVTKVKEKRPVISPNPGFLAQLQLYRKMNCKLDLNKLEFKLFKLENFTAELKKGRNFDLVKSIMAKDPGNSDNNKDADVYKCKMCRRQLFTALNVLAHSVGQKPTWLDTTWQVGEETEEGQCSQGLFTEPLEWMEEPRSTLQGKLSCPKCSSKVGNFNWLGSQCPCGVKVVPGFHINFSKIDECKSAQN